MISDADWRAEWMFRLLDYEHYRVFHREIELCLVVVNHADQSVSCTWFDDVDTTYLPRFTRNYRWTRDWLRRHETPLP